MADGGELGSICQVFLSTFPFEDMTTDSKAQGSMGDIQLHPCRETQNLTYNFGAQPQILKVPYILTCWDVDTALYLCLPLLSCNPKIVKFNLQNLGEMSGVQTLKNPLFFPNSTPCRGPRILYRTSPAEKKDTFVLA